MENIANPWYFQPCSNLVWNKVVTTKNFHMGCLAKIKHSKYLSNIKALLACHCLSLFNLLTFQLVHNMHRLWVGLIIYGPPIGCVLFIMNESYHIGYVWCFIKGSWNDHWLSWGFPWECCVHTLQPTMITNTATNNDDKHALYTS